MSDNRLRAISQEISEPLISRFSLKITYLKFHPHLPGASELSIAVYICLQLGEVWTEVIAELEQEELRPVTPDREALEAISRTVEDRAQHVVEVQKELLHAQGQQNLIEEQEFYAEVGGTVEEEIMAQNTCSQ